MKKLIYIALILGLLSCEEDDNDIVTDSIKPKKIIEITNETQDTSYYSYDGANPTLIESNNQLITFEYQSNKLSKRKIFRKGDDIPWLYQEYEYNSESKLIKESYYINENSTVEGWIDEPIDSYRLSAYYIYEYNGDKPNIEYYVNNYTNDTSSYTLIEYDSNNNITSKNQYTHSVGEYVKLRAHKYIYDNKNHYFKNVNYPAFGKIFSIVSNILIEEKTGYSISWDYQTGHSITDSTKTTYNYSYEYNEFDYPVRIEENNRTMIIEY